MAADKTLVLAFRTPLSSKRINPGVGGYDCSSQWLHWDLNSPKKQKSTPANPIIEMIHPLDRSYLYGDSLYEVVRTYNKSAFAMREHMGRLLESAKLCNMESAIRPCLGAIQEAMEQGLELFFKDPEFSAPGIEAYCRVVVSRGVGKIGFSLKQLRTPPHFTVIVQKLEPPTLEQFKRGAHLHLAARKRNPPEALTPAMKSGNYLNSLLAYLEGTSLGMEDSLLCNSDGHLTEGTTFNLFYIRNQIIATPPFEIGILDGITRKQVIQLAYTLGLEVREVRFPPERLFEADEVFITSTIKEVFPVTRIDQYSIGNGKPGPITEELALEFKAKYSPYSTVLKPSKKVKK